MAKSLQEQLMGAGLVDKQKAKSIQKDKRKKRKQAGKGEAQQEVLLQQLRVEEQKKAKIEKDLKLNRVQSEAQQAKAIRAQVGQLIQSNKVDREPGEIGFQFVDNKKIKKIFVNKEQHLHLSKGLLAIASFAGDYTFIPSGIAERISQRHAESIVYLELNREDKLLDSDENDPYKDYIIPDDLMW